MANWKGKRDTSKVRKIDGIPVVDATKGVTIEVTSNDINKSARKDPAGCAAAKAIMRQDKTITAARVHSSVIYLMYEGKKQWVRYKTPTGLHIETVSYDRGGKMQPGTYCAEPFPESGRLGARSDRDHADRAHGNHDHKPASTRAPAHHIADVREHARGRS